MSISDWTTIIAGALVLIVYFMGRLDKRRDKAKENIIRTKVNSTEIISPEAVGVIAMSAEINRLKTKSSAKKSVVAVANAHKYVIDVSNVGTDDLLTPGIDISFDENAFILNFEISSNDIPRDQIEIVDNIQGPYHRRVIPKYMNIGQSLTITIISINNERSNYPVALVGKGIKHQIAETESSAKGSGLLSAATIIAMVLGIVVYIIVQYGAPK